MAEDTSPKPPPTDEAAPADESEGIRGPHFWLNWQAEREGYPARSSSQTSGILIVPLWEEYGLYSDARFTSELAFGPYELLLAFWPDRHIAEPRELAVGQAELSLILRATDHLQDPSAGPIDHEEVDVEAYADGDLGDQAASLLSLALARRMRSGGVMRRGREQDPKGKPFYGDHHPPHLIAPRYRPMLPLIAEPAVLNDAEPYLEAFAQAGAADAVALHRAAHQFADALWWADADPRIAWIKLFGAVEAAANRWDIDRHPDPEEQLERRHPVMFKKLRQKAPEGILIVAKAISRTLGAEAKMIDFIMSQAPDPPEHRPSYGQLDWSKLEDSLGILYNHRSLDLHAGIPFPWPLCMPPESDSDGVPLEIFSALAAAGGGGSWPAHELPMYLHTFVHIVGEALRNWWKQLPS